jgi:hypothetical protein
MMQLAQIAGNNGTPTTYLALSAVLAFLVFLTFWREMSSGDQTQFFERTFAVISFAGSRVVIVLFTGAMIAERGAPPMLYMLLNLVCLYLTVVCMPGAFRTPDGDARKEHVGVGSIPDIRAFRIQVFLFAVAGAAVYIFAPKPGLGGSTFSGLAAATMFAATLRVLVRFVRTVRSLRRDYHVVLITFTGFCAASFFLLVGASLLRGDVAVVMLQAARRPTSLRYWRRC